MARHRAVERKSRKRGHHRLRCGWSGKNNIGATFPSTQYLAWSFGLEIDKSFSTQLPRFVLLVLAACWLLCLAAIYCNMLWLRPLPPLFFPILVAMVATYLVLVEVAKARFFRPPADRRPLARPLAPRHRRVRRLSTRWI